MKSDSGYIKEIESYFLKLAGEGIMLSPIDYSLIRDWKKRRIPMEVVLKGINRAFSGSGVRPKGTGAPRSLKQCAKDVEKCMEEYGLPAGEKGSKRKAAPVAADSDIPERLGRLINEERDPALRDYYIRLRRRVLGAGKAEGAEYISTVMEFEKEALEEFFLGLPDKEREKIGSQAEKMISERARYMTKSAYAESLVSFRNEILAKKYGIKCIIS